MTKPDPVRPFLGAATAFIVYWVVWNLLISPARFLGGEMVADTIPLLIAATAASALGMAILESRTLDDLGLRWCAGSSRPNLLLGIALGAGGAALLILPSATFGLAHFEHLPNADTSWPAALFAPLLLLCGAAGEEIVFRGFMLQYLMRGYGNWAGILGIGMVFGLLHAGNPGATTPQHPQYSGLRCSLRRRPATHSRPLAPDRNSLRMERHAAVPRRRPQWSYN